MTRRPSVAILHASGTNRDGEAARACELAGADTRIVHMNELRAGLARLDDHQALIIPGGFSYGDALGAGARLALDLRAHLADELAAFVESGRPVLGVCNGFQTLVKAGLLPGRRHPVPEWPVTLTHNAHGRFECRWVHLAPAPNATASWVSSLGEPIFCPVAHGEGRIAIGGDEPDAVVGQLADRGLIAFRYVGADGAALGGAHPGNPNGSAGDIAGLCNAAGNVVGLMPHPEDHLLPVQRPTGGPGGAGLSLFEAMVAAT